MNKQLAKRKLRSKTMHKISDLRIVVHKSNKHLYLQLIDGLKGVVLVSSYAKKNDLGSAREAGLNLGKKIKIKKTGKVVFDKSGYKYHGKIKEIADGIRQAGIKI